MNDVETNEFQHNKVESSLRMKIFACSRSCINYSYSLCVPSQTSFIWFGFVWFYLYSLFKPAVLFLCAKPTELRLLYT